MKDVNMNKALNKQAISERNRRDRSCFVSSVLFQSNLMVEQNLVVLSFFLIKNRVKIDSSYLETKNVHFRVVKT